MWRSPPAQLVDVLLTTVVDDVCHPGCPGGSIVAMVPSWLRPVCRPTAVGILLGADIIPDMFRTMANVTGGISAGVVWGEVPGFPDGIFMPVPAIPPDLAAALSDRYELRDLLGRGGMATVYLASDRKHHRVVALKVLRPELAATLGADRFLKEIQIVAQLTHPHILPTP
jgi:hypothetical protein